ncbi:MAG: flagellar export protein FliJ [Polyangiaceae bacterium]
MSGWIRKWTKIELRSRSEDARTAMRARIHDPAWFLCRQVQLRELDGEDAGSPILLSHRSHTLRASQLELRGSDATTTVAIGESTEEPIEVLVEREPPNLTYLHRLRLGRLFEGYLLEHAEGTTLRALFRFVAGLSPLSRQAQPTATDRALDLSRALAGRCVDGGRVLEAHWEGLAADALYESLISSTAGAPEGDAALREDGALRADVADHLRASSSRLSGWWGGAFSQPPTTWAGGAPTPASAWSDEHMEYRAAVTLMGATESLTLGAPEYHGGRMDWYDFVRESPTASVDPPTRTGWVIPDAVRYPGQPLDRFWEMERAEVSWGGVPVDRQDVPRLVLADYALVSGNDWFWTPLRVEAGTALSVDEVLVYDCFGEVTKVDPASHISPSWRMFDVEEDPGSTRAVLFVPSTVVGAAESEPIEEVCFVRDAAKDLAWAIEERLEGELDEPVSGTELALGRRRRTLERYLQLLQKARDDWMEARIRLRSHSGSPPAWARERELNRRLAVLERRAAFVRVGGDLRDVEGELPLPIGVDGLPFYRFMEPVPENQIPFVPVVPTELSATVRLQLQRYALPDILDFEKTGVPRRVRAKGRILRPDKRPFYLHEEEVPAEGIGVVRTYQLTRTASGQRVLWVGRRKRPIPPRSHTTTKNDRVVER